MADLIKKKPTLKTVFMNGILGENPIFRLVLGTCPTIALSTNAMNGIGMGLAVIFVLTCSNMVISLLRNIIPDKVRIPAFIVVVCTFVSIVDMLMNAYLNELYQSLGLFIPLIVVNCLILARAESFASKNGVVASAIDGIGMGIGFMLGLTLISMVREFFGKGMLFGVLILSEGFEGMQVLVQAPGGFIVFGLLLGLFNLIGEKIAKARGGKIS